MLLEKEVLTNTDGEKTLKSYLQTLVLSIKKI